MHKFKKILIPLLIVVSVLLFMYLILNPSKTPPSKTANIVPTSKSDFCLGTVVDIKVYDEASEDIFTGVFNILHNIENKMSINLDNSEVSNINKNAGKEEVKVSPETFYVINKGKYYSSLSNGHFDISIGPLVKLWGIGSDNARLPEPSEIKTTIEKIGYKDILLNESNSSVKLNRKDMMLDLGAIAKGYAADEVAKYLKSKNINNAIINLGGNVYAIGANPETDIWNIGIQNPFDLRGEHLGILHIKNKSIVTSGIYERYFEKDGKKYHHILNPFTGYPVENSLASVTIVSDKSIDGDGLSTTIFSLGIKDGSKLIESLGGVDAIFVTKDKKVYMTSGVKKYFEITNKDFSLITTLDWWGKINEKEIFMFCIVIYIKP